MADDVKDTGPQKFVGVICAAGALGTLAWVCAKIVLPVGTGGSIDRWQTAGTLGLLAIAVVIAFAVAALLRFALAPLIPSSPSPSNPAPASGDGDAGVRGKIGPMVLAIGSMAIVVLALALIISFAVLAYANSGQLTTKVDVLLTNVFTTVLPVVATWVGTVLAFYFGSENFRQAAESTQKALSGTLAPKKKITDVMIPYERVARLNAENEADAEESLTMLDVLHTLSAAAPRVIVFNPKTQTPIYVIRSTSPPMPANWVTPDYAPGEDLKKLIEADKDKKPPKLKVYLDVDKNRDDARKFEFIDENATPEAALDKMKKAGVDDLFVTKDGQKSSRVLGWLATADLLEN